MDISDWNWINWLIFSICIVFGLVLISLTAFIFIRIKTPAEKLNERLEKIKHKKENKKINTHKKITHDRRRYGQ